ncbi:unnamed protein product [Lymnaea stagnalis]|uniref:Uncharacterized protein n=1 Tax=Lymnaea stagnalis TaxID=6523 RepID=A0AAV2HB81_LYMST
MAQIDTTSIPEANNFDSVISPIVQNGNFFIMDSERLVSNPFRELQREAAHDGQRKSSMTDKLTGVKNNICENHFNQARSRLERQKMSRLKQLHDNSNKLMLEVKLLDLDRQRHHVEIKKRLQPDRDYSYDDTHILNTERRLGANIASAYLDKNLRYPMRLRSVSDIRVTPTIRKARACLRNQNLQKSLEDTLRNMSARSQPTRSASSPYTIPSAMRRGSRSATFIVNPSKPDANDVTTTLPAIPQRQALTTSRQDQQQPPRVKFASQIPVVEGDVTARLTSRSLTKHSDLTLSTNAKNLESSDDDDDDAQMPDFVDLRALFFNKGDHSNRSDSASASLTNPVSGYHLMALRKAQGPPPKLTTDMLQVEMEHINSKISDFMKTLNAPKGRGTDSDEDFDGHLVGNIPTPAPTGNARRLSNRAPVKPKSLEQQQTNVLPDVVVPLDTEPSGLSSPDNQDRPGDGQIPGKAAKSSKYSWRCIRGNLSNKNRDDYNPAELILQSLTGVPIGDSHQSHVPLRTASRALRHTATFKMQKIVEKLIHERTRYERLQVEELKKQLVEEEPGPVLSEEDAPESSSVAEDKEMPQS